MNDETTNRDQTDEEILTYTVSDDALEAAAGIGAANEPSLYSCILVNCTYYNCDEEDAPRDPRDP